MWTIRQLHQNSPELETECRLCGRSWYDIVEEWAKDEGLYNAEEEADLKELQFQLRSAIRRQSFEEYKKLFRRYRNAHLHRCMGMNGQEQTAPRQNLHDHDEDVGLPDRLNNARGRFGTAVQDDTNADPDLEGEQQTSGQRTKGKTTKRRKPNDKAASTSPEERKRARTSTNDGTTVDQAISISDDEGSPSQSVRNVPSARQVGFPGAPVLPNRHEGSEDRTARSGDRQMDAGRASNTTLPPIDWRTAFGGVGNGQGPGNAHLYYATPNVPPPSPLPERRPPMARQLWLEIVWDGWDPPSHLPPELYGLPSDFVVHVRRWRQLNLRRQPPSGHVLQLTPQQAPNGTFISSTHRGQTFRPVQQRTHPPEHVYTGQAPPNAAHGPASASAGRTNGGETIGLGHQQSSPPQQMYLGSSNASRPSHNLAVPTIAGPNRNAAQNAHARPKTVGVQHPHSERWLKHNKKQIERLASLPTPPSTSPSSAPALGGPAPAAPTQALQSTVTPQPSNATVASTAAQINVPAAATSTPVVAAVPAPASASAPATTQVVAPATVALVGAPPPDPAQHILTPPEVRDLWDEHGSRIPIGANEALPQGVINLDLGDVLEMRRHMAAGENIPSYVGTQPIPAGIRDIVDRIRDMNRVTPRATARRTARQDESYEEFGNRNGFLSNWDNNRQELFNFFGDYRLFNHREWMELITDRKGGRHYPRPDDIPVNVPSHREEWIPKGVRPKKKPPRKGTKKPSRRKKTPPRENRPAEPTNDSERQLLAPRQTTSVSGRRSDQELAAAFIQSRHESLRQERSGQRLRSPSPVRSSSPPTMQEDFRRLDYQRRRQATPPDQEFDRFGQSQFGTGSGRDVSERGTGQLQLGGFGPAPYRESAVQNQGISNWRMTEEETTQHAIERSLQERPPQHTYAPPAPNMLTPSQVEQNNSPPSGEMSSGSEHGFGTSLGRMYRSHLSPGSGRPPRQWQRPRPGGNFHRSGGPVLSEDDEEVDEEDDE